MTEKSHNRFRKKGADRSSYQVNNAHDTSSYAADTFPLNEMLKSLAVSPQSKTAQPFEDQTLMSEIGKFFFTSMMKFSHMLNSQNAKPDQNTLTLKASKQKLATSEGKKPQKKTAKLAKTTEKDLSTEASSDKTAATDSPSPTQYRKKEKNRKNKTFKQKFTSHSNMTEPLEQTTKTLSKKDTKNPSLDLRNLSKDKVSSEKPLPTAREPDHSDYGLSTQCEHLDSNFTDFQAPTPKSQVDDKQRLNLNIYRFINNCVSLNEAPTTDTLMHTENGQPFYLSAPPTGKKSGRASKTASNDKNKKNDQPAPSSKKPTAAATLKKHTRDAATKKQKPDEPPFKQETPQLTTNNETDEEKLLMMCFSGDLDSVKKLKDCNLDFVDEVGRSAVHYACTSGSLELVKYLLSKNVDLNKRDVKGWTPLFIATVKGHEQIVKLLLDHGADLNLTLRHRCAPTRLTDAHSHAVHFAAIKLNRPMMELFLSKNVDVNQKDSQGLTPLSYACYRSDPQFVAFLLDNGANPNIQDVNGRNSFHSVALGGSLEVANVLLKKLGLQNPQDRWSLTPSKLAHIKGFNELSDLFKNSKTSDDPSAPLNDVDDSDDMYLLLSTTIASALNEPNSDQIYRCLTRLGPDVVKTLFELTLKVEKSGGVTTADGKRNRTPGGVFFTLLKQMHLNNYITKEDYQYIRAAEKERLKSQNNANSENNRNATPKATAKTPKTAKKPKKHAEKPTSSHQNAAAQPTKPKSAKTQTFRQNKTAQRNRNAE